MSYNYEITETLTNENSKKKITNSKYTYTHTETNSQIFIFELILKTKNHQQQVIRKIRKSNQGSLITFEDNILYQQIYKYKLTVLNANAPNDRIVVKDSLNHSLTTSTFMNDNIYIEINQGKQNLMEFNYFIR